MPTVSHRSLIVSSPTNEAMSANAMCFPKAEVRGSNPFGRANDLNHLRPAELGISGALSAVCPRNLFGARSHLLDRCILWATGFKSALIATYESGDSCDVEDSDLREHFAGRA